MAVNQWMMTGLCSVFRVAYKWDVSVTSGLNTADSWTLVLDDFEFELFGWTCATADTGSVS